MTQRDYTAEELCYKKIQEIQGLLDKMTKNQYTEIYQGENGPRVLLKGGTLQLYGMLKGIKIILDDIILEKENRRIK